jgi:hypothetical protein
MLRSIRRYSKPALWETVETLLAAHEKYIPEMNHLKCFRQMTSDESLYALFSYASYRFSYKNPLVTVGDHRLLGDLSDDNSVVYMKDGKHIVISFTGTRYLNMEDIITDLFVTFGRESETVRFSKAVEKVKLIMNSHPLLDITVCGHSLGGTQAIYVSKLFGFEAYAYNPAQGISLKYLDDVNKYNNIHVLKITSDPVSCIAGLENVKGTTLFPKILDGDLIKNHSLKNFLPYHLQ